MHEHYRELVASGRSVEDADGDEIGTVVEIFESVSVPPTAVNGVDSVAVACLKVTTGFLGLGTRLYVPVSAIREVTGERVILTIDKSRIGEMGWDHRPAWIEA